MPHIASCPDCQRSLAIPSGTDAAQRLQCPRCGARFAAGQVLDSGAETPPVVLFVDANDVAHAAPQEGLPPLPSSPSFTQSPQPSALERLNAYLRESAAASSLPHEESLSAMASVPETPMGDAVATAAEPSLPQESAPAASSLAAWISGRATDADEAPQPQWNAEVDDVTGATGGSTACVTPVAIAGAEKSPEAPDADADRQRETHAGEESSQADAELGASFGVATTPRRKPAEVGAIGIVGNVLGMAAGAVIGLGLGYYILLWLGGARADFLELRDKLPRWLVPPARSNHVQKPRRSAKPDNERGLTQRADAPRKAAAGKAKIPDTAEASPRDPIELVSGHTPVDAGGTDSDDSPPGPLNYSTCTTDQLAEALNAVESALGCEVCGGTGYVTQEVGGGDSAAIPRRARCPQCKGKAAGTLTSAVFDRYCELAQVVTFLKPTADDPPIEEFRSAVKLFLLRVGADHDKAQVAGRLAGRRLGDPKRQGNGVLLLGTVQEAVQEGDLFRITLVLFGAPKTVNVLSFRAPQPPFSPHDQVAILGSIIDNPRENIGGYSGELSQIVWGGLPLKLAAAD